MRTRRFAIAIVMTLAATRTSAWAQKKTISVFPLQPTGLLPDQADIPDALSSAIAKELRAKLAKAPIDDAAGLLGCQVDSASCLSTITEQAGTPKIVFGQVIWNDMTRKLKVVLTKFEDGEGKLPRSWVLDSTSSEDAVPELMTRAQTFFDEISGVAEVPPPRRTCEDGLAGELSAECPEVRDPPDPKPPAAGITTGTYALIVGGGVATAVGVGFLVSAQGIRDEVDQAPDDSEQQIRDLMALEDKGKLHATVAYGMMLGGAALVTYGIVRALRERKPAASSSGDPLDADAADSTDLSMTPLPGGAALVFTARFP